MCVCVQYPTVHFLLAVYLLRYMDSDQSLVSDNFGLFTEIAVHIFLSDLAIVWPKTLLFCPLFVCIHFLHLFVPYKCPLLPLLLFRKLCLTDSVSES